MHNWSYRDFYFFWVECQKNYALCIVHYALNGISGRGVKMYP